MKTNKFNERKEFRLNENLKYMLEKIAAANQTNSASLLRELIADAYKKLENLRC